MRKAMITGATGRDAADLACVPVAESYGIHDVHRSISRADLWRSQRLNFLCYKHLGLVEGDLSDPASAIRSVGASGPDKIPNPAAQSCATMAISAAGLGRVWSGEEMDQVGIDRRSGRVLVRVDATRYGAAEARIVGDSSEAWLKFGWTAITKLEALCPAMVETDTRRARAAEASPPTDKASELPWLDAVGPLEARAEARVMR